jgi:hypothetical protein
MRQATKSGNAPRKPSEKKQVIKPDHVTRSAPSDGPVDEQDQSGRANRCDLTLDSGLSAACSAR